MFNNVSVAAAHALANGLAGRIAVVDYDVHHGNGTEKIFYDNPNVLVISMHEEGLYPLNSGHAHQTGAGEGVGWNVNIPLMAGCGDGAYWYAFERIVVPLLRKFAPDLILVSSGFDASTHDPLGHMMCTSSTYGKMASGILELGKPTLFCHEGGYSEVTSPFCGVRVVDTGGLQYSSSLQ